MKISNIQSYGRIDTAKSKNKKNNNDICFGKYSSEGVQIDFEASLMCVYQKIHDSKILDYILALRNAEFVTISKKTSGKIVVDFDLDFLRKYKSLNLVAASTGSTLAGDSKLVEYKRNYNFYRAKNRYEFAKYMYGMYLVSLDKRNRVDYK